MGAALVLPKERCLRPQRKSLQQSTLARSKIIHAAEQMVRPGLYRCERIQEVGIRYEIFDRGAALP